MDRKNPDVSLYQYIWVIVKSLFMVCLLILVISIFVMYFSMPDKIALFLTLFSMFVGIAFSGYEAAAMSPNRKKVAAFLVSVFVTVILFVLSIVFKKDFNVSKYQLYILLFGPIVGFLAGALNPSKAKRPRTKRR